MPEDPRWTVARREAWRSFGHKLGIVLVALLAYGGLVWLGGAKHDREKAERAKWQVTRANLQTLAETAEKVAPVLATQPAEQSRLQFVADTTLLTDIAAKFQGAEHAKGTASKIEFIAAVEQIVDARIWRDATLGIDKIVEDIKAQPVLPERAPAPAPKKREAATKQAASAPTPVRDLEHALDQIAAQESLARTRIAGTHALIEASATQVEKTEEKQPPIESMFDEKHPLYVLYEICWYMLLALAVLASSWLLITVFTVLPFTEAEGYWTKRIGEIIDKFAPGMASAVLPLASASLVAATVLAGTGFATTAGGTGRGVTNMRTTIDDRSTHTTMQQPPASLTSEDLERAVTVIQSTINGRVDDSEQAVRKAVNDRSGEIQHHLNGADELQGTTLGYAMSANGNASQAASNAADASSKAAVAVQQTTKVPDIYATAQQVAGVLGNPPKTTETIFGQVGSVDRHLSDGVGQIARGKKEIDDDHAESSRARNASFAQAAIVDPRGFFGRTLGRALFRVGPAAVYSMAALLGVKLTAEGKPDLRFDADGRQQAPDDHDTFITVLNAAMHVQPKHSGDFRQALYGLTSSESVKQLLKDYDRQLMHLCALQRD